MRRSVTRGIKALAVCALTTAIAGGAAFATEQEKAPGYRGIWFTLGQFSEHGDKYSGGLGTYTAKHKPLAIYAEEVNKTFFVYGGTTEADERHLLCMAGYYDHERNRVPRPTIVHDKEGVDDPHDNPSIAMDAEGHIWVFVSGRGQRRPGFKYRSSEPYCIDSFELIAEQELTYPQPWWVEGEGFFHYFTKYTDGRELYWERSEDGETWSEDVKLAGFGGHYQVSRERDGRLITAFNYHPGGSVDRRTNLYYAETDDFGETWRTVDGTELELPLEEVDNPALAHDYEADGRLVYLNDIDLDSDGHPVIQVVTSGGHAPGPENEPRYWELLRWNGAEWQRSVITRSDHNYDMGSLYIEDDNHWRLAAPTATGPQPWGTGGEMELWTSDDDGHSWNLERAITRNSARNHAYARRPLDPQPDFYAFWADGNPDELSISMLHFTNRDGSQVWTLPYTMTADYQAPVPLLPADPPKPVSQLTPRQAGEFTVWNEGDRTYTDRDITITSMPDILKGASGIRTSQNAGRAVEQQRFITFHLATEAHIFVAYDPRRPAPPNWLADEFQDTGLQVVTSSEAQPERDLYRKRVEPGEVVLGGNMAAGVPEGSSSGATYFVFVVPVGEWPFARHPKPASVVEGDTHTFEAALANPQGEVSYQWLHNGMPIPDATDASLTIENASRDDEGTYSVIAMDEGPESPFESRGAYLAVDMD